MSEAAASDAFGELAALWRRRQLRTFGRFASAMIIIAGAFAFTGALDPMRYADAWPTIARLVIDATPPDFSRWREWGRPLLETLATGVAGTAIGAAFALPLAAASARNVGSPLWLRQLLRLAMNAIRSLPGLVWAVLFVAAVGFGPLPGVLALGVHSTGMLGKLFFEAIEHVDPGPGAAMRAHGASSIGVFRFAILPQALPRLADATIYRFEHNLRAATTLGLVGAGGFGLELVTAFHLFEYREASALIIVLSGLVTIVNIIGATIRRRFLSSD